MSLGCAEARARLDDLVDERLTEAVRAEVEEHLDRCPACRGEHDELRRLLADAARLAGGEEPERDLWPEIEAAIRKDRWLPRAGVGRRRWAAAAALLLAIGLAVGVRQAVRPRGDAVPAAGTAVPLSDPELFAMAELARVEDGVLGVRKDLLEALARRGDELSPRERLEIERSLRLFDRSIGQLRAAIEEHPDDPSLGRMLADRYRQEIDLLKRISRV